MKVKLTRAYNVQAFFWIGLYLFWVLVFQRREIAFTRTATVEFCYLIFIAANFYFHTLYTIPRFLYKKKYGLSLLLFLAGVGLAALLRVPLAMYLNRNYFLVSGVRPNFADLYLASFLNIFVWSLCLLAGKLVADRFRFLQRLEEAEKARTRAELDFLNAQFNPHFLFNSINTIYSHIDKQNTLARKSLLTFSEMLRYQLYDCNQTAIPIEKEIAYLRNYIILQQERMGENYNIALEVAENVHSITISPLLFITFVENAFKHISNFDEQENQITMALILKDKQLSFMCNNTFEPGQVQPLTQKGIGITNARRRLELLYPGRHNLKIGEVNGRYEVVLNLNLA